MLQDTRNSNNENLEDLLDLDELLDESTKLAKAKKAKNQGRKLDADLEELLESSQDAEDHRLWEATGMLTHFIETTCGCGETQRRFAGWFQVFTHRRLVGVHKIVRVSEPGDWGVESWTTVETSDFCAHCLDELEMGEAEPLEIFSALGEKIQWAEEEVSPQLAFDFDGGEEELSEEDEIALAEALDLSLDLDSKGAENETAENVVA